MTTVQIQPGICGFTTKVEAVSEDQDTFDAFELCLVKPGHGPLFEYAGEHFPIHAACPVIAGIIKCAEVECRLALPADAQIQFL